jgi:DNA primase
VTRVDLATLRSAAISVFPSLLNDWLPTGEIRGREYVAFNPMRDDRHVGSFRIDMQTGSWRDHAIGVGGSDVISILAYLKTNGDYGRAIQLLAGEPLVRAAIACGAAVPAARAAKPANRTRANVELARRLYAAAVPLADSVAAAYLAARSLVPTDAWEPLRATTLRYPGGGRHPVLIAPVTSLEGPLVGIHRTYLAPPGRKLDVPAPKLTLGQVRSCAVRFGRPNGDLIICEGIEDALSLYQQLDGLAVWAASGSALLPLMQIPKAVRNLTIAADNDPAGELAAQRAADALQAPGRVVRIMRPGPGFKDFNDELRGVRHDR